MFTMMERKAERQEWMEKREERRMGVGCRRCGRREEKNRRAEEERGVYVPSDKKPEK
jgi:hypothetical protein